MATTTALYLQYIRQLDHHVSLFLFFSFSFSSQPQRRRNHHRYSSSVSTVHARQRISTYTSNAFLAMSARQQAGKRVAIHANASTSAVLKYFLISLFRFTNHLSPATPVCLHAGQHVPDHASATAGRAMILATSARLQAGKHVPSQANTSTCRARVSACKRTCPPQRGVFFFYLFHFTNLLFTYIIHVDIQAPSARPEVGPYVRLSGFFFYYLFRFINLLFTYIIHVGIHVVVRHPNILFLYSSCWCDQMCWLPKYIILIRL